MWGGLLASLIITTASAQLPAFPGADGAAQHASGGRGGLVYHVTKLNLAVDDPGRSDSGTFLYGLNDANFPAGVPRTIVFDVAGVFHLGILDTTNWTSGGNAWTSQSRQSISTTNLTIAGQTAPGPVIFMGGTLKPSGSNIVIRNITVAAGYGMKGFWEPPPKTPPTYPALPTSYTMDAFDVSGQNVILDHVDAIYGSDETISCNEKANNLTIQYRLNAQGQNYNGHAYGHLLQPNTNFKLSFLNNLDAHLISRLPRVGTERTQLTNPDVGSINDFRNSVVYNWFGNSPGYAGNTTEAPNQPSANNFINNFYLSGSGGDDGISSTQTGGSGRLFQGNSPLYTQAYVDGNRKDVNKDGDPYDDIATTAGTDSASDFNLITVNAAAWDVSIGVTLTARAAFTNVLKHVGSRWWERDLGWPPTNAAVIGSHEVNERIIYETYTGTGRIEAWADDPYDEDPSEGVEWRALWALRAATNGVAPFNRPVGWDTDQDGMPNDWEMQHGLNPDVANNNSDFDSDGYTDLEEYLNEVAAWPAPGQIVFTGATNNRYAEIFNWRVTGVPVNISGMGNLPTSSPWQPSRYDTAIISNTTVLVDAVGQHAGILRLTGGGVLNITNGWLKAGTLEVGAGCVLTVQPAGTLRLTGSGSVTLDAGGTFTNAGLLDIITWSGTLPAGFVNTGTVLDRSLIRVTSAQASGTDFQVSIQGYTGHNYQLQYQDDLLSGTWTNTGVPIAGTNAPITLTHAGGAAAKQRFYRVAVD